MPRSKVSPTSHKRALTTGSERSSTSIVTLRATSLRSPEECLLDRTDASNRDFETPYWDRHSSYCAGAGNRRYVSSVLGASREHPGVPIRGSKERSSSRGSARNDDTSRPLVRVVTAGRRRRRARRARGSQTDVAGRRRSEDRCTHPDGQREDATAAR